MARYFIIGGHGSGTYTDPGAVGNGQEEWKLARKFNDLLAKYLKELKQSVTVYNSSGSVNTTKDMYQQSLKGQGLYSFKVDDRIVIETHLNAASKTAHGTELWIGSGLAPDKYDKAINKVLGKYFAQRGIKKSSALLNMNIAKARGINYRLIELCFISNKADVTKFVKEMDKIAREMAEELTDKSLAPKKKSEAIGKIYFMFKDMRECWLYVYPWDIMLFKTDNNSKYAHFMEIVTSGRDIFEAKTGKRVNTWKSKKKILCYMNTTTEKKITKVKDYKDKM